MREIRLYGSEGREPERAFLPLCAPVRRTLQGSEILLQEADRS